MRTRRASRPVATSPLRRVVAVVAAIALAASGVPTAAIARGGDDVAAETAGETPAAASAAAPAYDTAPAKEQSPLDAVSDDAVAPPAKDVAPDAAGGDGLGLATQASGDNIATGTWGTCAWEIDSEGTLWVHAGKGDDLGWQKAPWYSNRTRINSAVLEGDVELPRDCSYMFSGCSSLSSLNASGWNTSAVRDMTGMFYGCTSLSSLDVSGCDTSGVTRMYCMFYGCSSLSSLDVSRWDTSKVTNMAAMFFECSSLDSPNVTGWDTSSVETMASMFAGCSSLSSLDVSRWVTSKVTDMDGMFHECSALDSLDISGWDTSSVENMQSMFFNCKSLASLDISGWVTSNVTDMSTMFRGCTAIVSIDVSGWDTSKVTTMEGTFSRCASLATLDVSGWNTSSVKTMRGMFRSCASLPSLDPSGWNTSKVTDMRSMFEYCSSLASLDVSGWNTSNVMDMSYMFQECPSLATLDLSGWNTSRVGGAWSMFANTHPTTFRVGDRYKIDEAAMVPEPGDGCLWRSEETGELYGRDEIVATRSNVADTYVQEAVPPFDISGATVGLEPASFTYDGNAKTPAAKVELGGVALAEDVDFIVAYEGNVDAGTATAVVSGVGNYSGSVSRTFTIARASLSTAKVTLPAASYEQTGRAVEPVPTASVGGRTLEAGKDFSVWYFNNVSPGIATVVLTGVGNYEGAAAASFRIERKSPAPAPSRVDMYRLYNPYSGEHFYTASARERDVLIGVGWNYAGLGGRAPEGSEAPVYRLYNPNAGDHHYTPSIEERNALLAVGWNYEGVGWYSDDAKGTPLYRQYNPNAVTGTHNYTTSAFEAKSLVAAGWRDEGIGWYGV